MILAVIPSEVEESRGVSCEDFCGILRLRFAQDDGVFFARDEFNTLRKNGAVRLT